MEDLEELLGGSVPLGCLDRGVGVVQPEIQRPAVELQPLLQDGAEGFGVAPETVQFVEEGGC